MATSEWNSSYWLDQLAKLSEEKKLDKIYGNQKDSNILVEVDEHQSTIPTPPHTTAGAVPTIGFSQDPFSLDSWLSSNSRDSIHAVPTISLPQLVDININPVETVTIRLSELMNDSSTNTKTHGPINITCSLADLVNGTGGIQQALDAIEGKAEEKRDVVSFSSLVEEEKELKKQRETGLNTSAKEFSLPKQTNTSAKELSLPKQTRAGLNVAAKEYSAAPTTGAGLNIEAKEFSIPATKQDWKFSLNAEEFVFKPAKAQKEEEKEVVGTNVNGTVFYPYVPSTRK